MTEKSATWEDPTVPELDKVVVSGKRPGRRIVVGYGGDTVWYRDGAGTWCMPMTRRSWIRWATGGEVVRR